MKNIVKTIKEEFISIIPPTLFFFVAIGLLMLTKRLMLQQYGIEFSDAAGAVVGALIIGKVILIVDHLPFVNRFPEKPLIYNVAWKTFIYVIVAFIVRIAEHVVPIAINNGSVKTAIMNVWDEIVWSRFFVIFIWLSVLLLAYCILRELIRVIGRDQFLKLFLGITRQSSGKPEPV